MLYKYHYNGDARINNELVPVSLYTLAKTEARAAMNIRWRLHKETDAEIVNIQLFPDYIKVVGGYKGPGYPDNPDQVTLWDLFPEAMGVVNG